jgi:hypothetical protein
MASVLEECRMRVFCLAQDLRTDLPYLERLSVAVQLSLAAAQLVSEEYKEWLRLQQEALAPPNLND